MHPWVKDDHVAVIGPRTDPMGPGTSRERPWDAQEQADEVLIVLIARSRFHPLTHLAASLAETTKWSVTSPNTRAAENDTEVPAH